MLATSVNRPRAKPACGSRRPSWLREHGQVIRFGNQISSDAIVNSPSTTVAVRNADVSRATRMLGTRTRNIVVVHPAPSEREASTSVRRSMARSPASSAR